jgi:hypothetical protein
METTRLLNQYLLPDVALLALSYLEPTDSDKVGYARTGFAEKITLPSRPSGAKRALAALMIGYRDSVKSYEDAAHDTIKGLGAGGHITLIDKMLVDDSDLLWAAFIGACSSGDTKCARQLIERGVDCDGGKLGLFHACVGHHIDIIDMIHAQKWYYPNHGLWGACYGGHMELALSFIGAGADNMIGGLYNACSGGHLNIAKLILSHGIDDYTMGFNIACVNNRLEIVKYIIAVIEQVGVPIGFDINDAYLKAIHTNSKDVVEYLGNYIGGP